LSYLAGSVSSAGRAIPHFDAGGRCIVRSKGACVWDNEGREYLDTVMGFGATMLGHAPDSVVDAVARALAAGPMPGFSNSLEENAAEALAASAGDLSKVMFANSGSEAVHRACQMARAITGRKTIVKIAGAYDGWFDELTLGRPGSPEAESVRPEGDGAFDFVLLRYNDEQDIDRVFSDHSDIAGVLFEPVLANAGCLMPEDGFLHKLQKMARQNGALLIADEVLIGFRLNNGLATHLFGLSPDIAVVGKAIGSGLPVAAVLSTAAAEQAARASGFSSVGTYNGNPIACAAVIATAGELARLNYSDIDAGGLDLVESIIQSAKKYGFELCHSGYGSVFTLWPSAQAPGNYSEVLERRNPQFSERLHNRLLEESVLTMPDPLGRVFLTRAHDSEVIEALKIAYERAFSGLAASR
jgi:glutamate-1-semialdehyde 2,1-aminomutase